MLHCFIGFLTAVSPSIIGESTNVCFIIKMSDVNTFMFQSVSMDWIYVNLLEIPFKDTHLELSLNKARILKTIIILKTAGYFTFGVFWKLTTCQGKHFPNFFYIILFGGMLHASVNISLLVFYKQKLNKLLNIQIELNERAVAQSKSVNDKKKEKSKNEKLTKIVEIAKRHTKLVYTSILSTWILSVGPMLFRPFQLIG